MARSDWHRWAGQMVVCAPAGATADTHLVRLIEEFQVGGVILFQRNCPSSDEVRSLTEAMQRRAELPLLVMIDQEGGRVMRLKERRFRLPSAREQAARHREEVEHDAYMLGKRFIEIGVNMNLVPVLDVDSNPANPIIGDRSYGRDPATVWTYAEAVWRGQKKAGILSCGKHFPGHGDTDNDSHLTLPIVRHERERLERIELEPFKRAIEAGFEALMIAHVLYPVLDPDEPASLSPAITTELLRNELGFKGLILADDLEMKAISERYPLLDLVEKLVLAGNDLLPVCHSHELAMRVCRALVTLVERGRITENRMKASYDRIYAIKRRYGLFEGPM